MGGSQSVCGAVTGALMALGVMAGREAGGDQMRCKALAGGFLRDSAGGVRHAYVHGTNRRGYEGPCADGGVPRAGRQALHRVHRLCALGVHVHGEVEGGGKSVSQFKFAFLIMTPDHDSAVDRVMIEKPSCKSVVVGVNSIEDACARAKELIESGAVNKIELCGAFGKDGARRVSQALGGGVPVGYIVDFEE